MRVCLVLALALASSVPAWAVAQEPAPVAPVVAPVVAPPDDDVRLAEELYELRARNTEICVSLSREAIGVLLKGGEVESRPQARRGRYYSFMPAAEKEICVQRFREFTARLDGELLRTAK